MGTRLHAGKTPTNHGLLYDSRGPCQYTNHTPEGLLPLGRHRAAAANETDTVVLADVFRAPESLDRLPVPRSEIEEARFVDPASPEPGWAPLFTERILPLLNHPVG